jgi:hypothetical protein
MGLPYNSSEEMILRFTFLPMEKDIFLQTGSGGMGMDDIYLT